MIGDHVRLITEGQSIVPVGAVHRIEKKISLIFIEVQIGIYLGEDDIIRYEDAYSRN